ncbi:MAG: hypothetical protein MI810_16810 [Flavobacteriales bacterium]|nr:hypothetical protein [Flavobacteriales bacterium]
MKSLFLVSFLISTLAFAEKLPERIASKYVVVSDKKKENVPDGTVRLKGTIHVSGEYFLGARVSTPNAQNFAEVNGSGTYEMYLSPSDTLVYFFKAGLEEIVVSDYDFKEGHEVIIDFYPQIHPDVIEVEKPVIYLYSDEPLTATVNLESKGDMTFTYPEYNEGWEVQVNEDGNLTDLISGTEVPYLFWEAEMEAFDFGDDPNGAIEGFLIHTDTTVAFLENVLEQMGLNSTEAADFITFWGPRLIEEKHAFIQFKVDLEYAQKIAEINISPEPDHMKRIYMVFTPLESEDEIDFDFIEQSLKSFERNGFVVLEWGGSKLPKSSLYKAI